jgi:hypothetical protein
MGKNPLDLHRKLQRYQQPAKILRRGLQVSVTNLESIKPDFALGTYQVKGGTNYSLIINVDLPKKSTALKVDFWGLNNNNNHLQHLNQGKINLINRDSRLKFWTYPKTRHIFMTFELEQDEDGDPEKPGKIKCHYTINYVFIESKNPIPRSLDTPSIPQNLNLEYNIECAPRLILELEIDNILKDFNLPINLDIFEHALLVYLLQKETSPEYLNSLRKNLELCHIKYEGTPSQFRQVDVNELKELQQEISKASKKLEEYMVRVDNLINHKHGLENMLDQPEDMTPYEIEQHQLNINLHQQFIESLNLKLNHVHKLQEINQNQPDEEDFKNMQEILSYYEKRILADQTLVTTQFKKHQELYQSYQRNILGPKSDRQNKDQDRLDKVLVDYRKIKKKCCILKEHLDEKLIKFMSLWYQYVIQQNSSVG